MKKQIYLFMLFLGSMFLFACSTVEDSRSAVPHSVEKYMRDNGTDFKNYELSSLEIEHGYNEHRRIYDVYENLETVWSDYMNADPCLAFNSRILEFGVLFNPDDSTLYSTDNRKILTFREGQIYILNLKFMGIFNFPVAFKVNKLDYKNKMIEFIYMKKNIANGFQQIYFTSDYDSNGQPVTRIEHLSHFKSGWGIQDKFIYPSFHKKTIDEFHVKIFKSSNFAWTEI